jgi:hypothetical protein
MQHINLHGETRILLPKNKIMAGLVPLDAIGSPRAVKRSGHFYKDSTDGNSVIQIGDANALLELRGRQRRNAGSVGVLLAPGRAPKTPRPALSIGLKSKPSGDEAYGDAA